MSFQDFAKKQVQITPTQSGFDKFVSSQVVNKPVQTSSFDNFVKNQSQNTKNNIQPIQTTTEKPYWERNGLIQSMFSPAYRLGQEVARNLTGAGDVAQEAIKQTEENQKFLADQIKNNKSLDDRARLNLVRILEENPTESLPPARNAEQIIGDVILTAAMVAPVGTFSSVSKALGGGVLGKLAAGGISGATAGALFGGGEALSENKDISGVASQTAKGALTGGLLGGALSGIGVGISKGLSKTKEILSTSKVGQSINDYISSVGNRLQRFGDEGKEIYSRVLAQDNNAKQRFGSFLVKADESGLGKLSRASKLNVLDALEGRINQSILTPEENKLFTTYSEYLSKTASEASAKGLKISTAKGEKIPFTSRKNYAPHEIISADDVLNETKLYKDAIQDSVRRGEFKNIEEASAVAKDYATLMESSKKGLVRGVKKSNKWVEYMAKNNKTSVKFTEEELQKINSSEKLGGDLLKKLNSARDEAMATTMKFAKRSRSPQSGSLEKSREFNSPFYNPDIDLAMLRYAEETSGRLSAVEQFGARSEIIGNIMRKASKSLNANDFNTLKPWLILLQMLCRNFHKMKRFLLYFVHYQFQN